MGVCSSFGSLAESREQKVVREVELVMFFFFSFKWEEKSNFWDAKTEIRDGSKALLVEGITPWLRDVEEEEERSELANAKVAIVADGVESLELTRVVMLLLFFRSVFGA